MARGLSVRGLHMTVVDYTDDMVEVGRGKLPGIRVEKADLRSLPYSAEFDSVFLIGRVFTHMTSDDDLAMALTACRRALKKDGRLFFDNYEDSKIQRTDYFNGLVKCSDVETSIERRSTTTKISDTPYVVRWDATYSGRFNGTSFSFSDSIPHRAFSRSEISRILPEFGFALMCQGDNFDDTSFYTLAKAAE